VGIMPLMPSRPVGGLRPLDRQILNSLRKNSRKPVSEVAAEVKASAKTVHRRLEKMVEEGLIELTIDWYPDASNDIVSLCHIEIAQRSDRHLVLESLRKAFGANILFEIIFSNLPNLLVLFLWTNSMKQMEDLRENISKEASVKSVMLNVLQIGYMSDTWRDSLPAEGPKLRAKH